MAHWSASTTSRSPATGSLLPSESFASGLSRGMATPTPAPDLLVTPPLGVRSGLPLIPCPECGDAVVEEYEYIPGLGGSTAGNPSSRRRSETEAHGGCSFFKTQEEYEAIPRDRGLLGPAATPEQERSYRVLVQAPNGFLVPAPLGNPEWVATMEDLKHEMVAQKLAIAQLKTDIQDFMGKGKLGAADEVEKATKTDSLARWAKAIAKWFFVASAVVLLFGMVVAMSVK